MTEKPVLLERVKKELLFRLEVMDTTEIIHSPHLEQGGVVTSNEYVIKADVRCGIEEILDDAIKELKELFDNALSELKEYGV